jgi:hypothetical protein
MGEPTWNAMIDEICAGEEYDYSTPCDVEPPVYDGLRTPAPRKCAPATPGEFLEWLYGGRGYK